MDEATVDITTARRDAVRIARTELAVGDQVFDVWGNTYPVAKVQQFKAHTTFRRSDGVVDVLAGDETITVIKG